MTDIWPATLPQFFEAAGYRESAPSNMLKTPMATGPDKRRRRSTTAIRPISGQIDCTAAQVETLDQFFNTTLRSGILSFTWVHPRTQLPATFKFAKEPDYGSPRGGGAYYRVSLSLELQP